MLVRSSQGGGLRGIEVNWDAFTQPVPVPLWALMLTAAVLTWVWPVPKHRSRS